jgi:hypothetical protein
MQVINSKSQRKARQHRAATKIANYYAPPFNKAQGIDGKQADNNNI